MASTLSPTQDDPRHDGDAAAPATDPFTDVEEELARLVDAHYAPRVSRAFGAAMLDADNLRPMPRAQRSPGRRGARARVAIAVVLGAAAIWAWASYGGPTRDIIATWAAPLGAIAARPAAEQTPQTPDPAPDPAAEQTAAPPAVETPAPPPAQAAPQTAAQAASQAASIAQPATTNAPTAAATEPRPVETSDLAALRHTVEKLAAGQAQLTRQIAKLQAEKPDKPPTEKPSAQKPEKRMPHRVSAHRAPPAAAPARKPAAITPTPPHAARQVSTLSPLPPPPQPAPPIASQMQPASSLRPPMPVPQP